MQTPEKPKSNEKPVNNNPLFNFSQILRIFESWLRHNQNSKPDDEEGYIEDLSSKEIKAADLEINFQLLNAQFSAKRFNSYNELLAYYRTLKIHLDRGFENIILELLGANSIYFQEFPKNGIPAYDQNKTIYIIDGNHRLLFAIMAGETPYFDTESSTIKLRPLT